MHPSPGRLSIAGREDGKWREPDQSSEGERPERLGREAETETGRAGDREAERDRHGSDPQPQPWAGPAARATHPAAGLVVVQVHEDARALVGALGMDALPLAGVHELLGEAVAVVDVVTAAAPQPVPGQVLGARGTAAAAGGQLALSARAAHGIDHPRGAHSVRESRLAAACGRGPVSRRPHAASPPTGLRRRGRGRVGVEVGGHRLAHSRSPPYLCTPSWMETQGGTPSHTPGAPCRGSTETSPQMRRKATHWSRGALVALL